ncbi:MAG: MauE/DoxX family redox-associated membrane protein, partial [Pirellulaceae bacterium]
MQATTADPLVRIRQWRFFQRIWAVFCLLLVIVSWRLWIPQQVFPQVPFISALRHMPALADWVLLLALIGALLGAMVFGRVGWQRSVSLIVFGIAISGLVLLDQHRLQAWAYQAIVIAVLLLGTPPRLGVTLLRVFAVSVYFYSAAGKFDFQFLHTVGQQFLETAADLSGVRIEAWEPATRVRAAMLLPLTELVLAVGALLPITRQWAGWGLVAMHAVLLVLLGPFGLQHQPGVLAWNGFLIAQSLVLFVGWIPADRQTRH